MDFMTLTIHSHKNSKTNHFPLLLGADLIGIGVCLHMFINDESHGIAHIYGSPVRLESPL